jgi:hypothetical protein
MEMTRALLVAILALGAVAAGAAGAQASCAAPPSLRDQVASAPMVLVGTVLFTSDNERVARVKVESIWRGPELPAYVDVHGSPVSGLNTASSVDRKYSAGTRYLFILFSADRPLQDNSCSATQVYTSELAALAPADARSPAPATALDPVRNAIGQYWLPALGFLALVAVAGFIGLRRSGRTR